MADLADYLVLRHHSAVGLVDRAEKDGLVRRNPDRSTRASSAVNLTPAGAAKLDMLAEAHLQEIADLAPTMRTLWRAVQQVDGHPAGRRPAKAAAAASSKR